MAGSAIIIAYCFIFFAFFPHVLFPPMDKGYLGHDYALGLPMLLDGYYWFKINGLSRVFWFTPSVCGGVPAFADPIHFYYSLPQFFTFVVNPYLAVVLTFFIFALIGFGGAYVLLRQIYQVGDWGSLLGATLFLFNGFYTYRMIIGHFIVHAYMLLPWCVWLLLRPPPLSAIKTSLRRSIASACVAGIFMAYMLYSGLQTLLPPVLLSMVSLCLIFGIMFPRRFAVGPFLGKLTGAGIVFLALSAAKISAVAHFMYNISRTQYSLPQFPRLSDLFAVLLTSLFGKPPWQAAQNSMVNMQLVLNRHEFEYGVTVVPLLFICVGLLSGLFLFWRTPRNWKSVFTVKRLVLGAICGIILCLPIVLNFYTPAWNRFLKTVPLIQSCSQNLRWFCLFIPIVIVLAGVALQRVSVLRKFQRVLAIAGIIFVVLWHISVDKSYYYDQSYSPAPVISSYRAVEQGGWQPGITAIGSEPPPAWWKGFSVARTDSLIFGYSQLLGWYSMFGYRLENFPEGALSPGSVWQEKNGYLNIKNPSCYVFPKENQCRPGDHFTVRQKKQVFAFTHYRPFSFQMSGTQQIANKITLGVLFAVILGGIFYLFSRLFWWRHKIASRATETENYSG